MKCPVELAGDLSALGGQEEMTHSAEGRQDAKILRLHPGISSRGSPVRIVRSAALRSFFSFVSGESPAALRAERVAYDLGPTAQDGIFSDRMFTFFVDSRGRPRKMGAWVDNFATAI
jgi:hypothetical protein